jgi:DNA-directed RNA polymerase subunit RPC12/RpoP
MIGYKCNACGNKIAESKYNYLKGRNELRCEKCRSGFYTPYFEDEDGKDDDLLNFSPIDTNIDSE